MRDALSIVLLFATFCFVTVSTAQENRQREAHGSLSGQFKPVSQVEGAQPTARPNSAGVGFLGSFAAEPPALKAYNLTAVADKTLTSSAVMPAATQVSAAFRFSGSKPALGPSGPSVDVDLGYSVETFVLARTQSENRSPMKHHHYVSEANQRSWLILTVDEGGNPFLTVNRSGERQSFASLGSGELLRFSGNSIPQAPELFSEAVLRTTLVRHMQVVELYQRRVRRHQSTWSSHRLVYASGGDLGVMQGIDTLRPYLKSIDLLLDGASRLADAPVREVRRDDEVIYYVSPIVDGIPVFASDLRITAQAETGAVLRIGGPVYNPPPVEKENYAPDSTALAEALSRHLAEKGMGTGFEERVAPELTWCVFEDELALVWRGTVRVSGEGPITYYIDAHSHQVLRAGSEIVGLSFTPTG